MHTFTTMFRLGVIAFCYFAITTAITVRRGQVISDASIDLRQSGISDASIGLRQSGLTRGFFCKKTSKYQICSRCPSFGEDCTAQSLEDDCYCEGIKIWYESEREFFGGPDCQSSVTDNPFCYVGKYSKCPDKEESTLFKNIAHLGPVFSSEAACKTIQQPDFGNSKTMKGYKVVETDTTFVETLENIADQEACSDACSNKADICGAWSFRISERKCMIHTVNVCCGQFEKLEMDQDFVSGFFCPTCWSTHGECPCSEFELVNDQERLKNRTFFGVKDCGIRQAYNFADIGEQARRGSRLKNNIESFPWLVKIELDGKQHCVGGLINNDYIMTAAQCVNDNIDVSKLKFIFGVDDTTDRFQDVHKQERVAGKVILHPLYKANAIYYNIALIRLDKPIISYTNYISPVCLPAKAETDLTTYENLAVTMAGFGVAKHDNVEVEGASGVRLSFTSLGLRHPAYCNSKYFGQTTDPTSGILHEIRSKMPLGKLTDNLNCAGEEGYGACYNDTGAPYVQSQFFPEGEPIRFIALGVGAGLEQCGDGRFPDLYVRLDDSNVLEWIKEVAFDYIALHK